MKTGSIVFAVIVVGSALFAFSSVGTYNDFVTQDESVTRAWANVETQYQRRSDLIPNLVNTVRGAAEFESETLEAVTRARSRATSISISASDLGDPAKMEEFMAAQQGLGASLGRLLAISESYPELRATESFRDLQVQLEGTENRINQARRDYNGAVSSYNTRIRKFPGSMIAGMTGFSTKVPFEAQSGAEKAPIVEF